jgi:hypothetical protein
MTLTEGLMDTLRQIRYRRPRPVFCPRCESSDIHPIQNFGILPEKYMCHACGYEGVIVLELIEDKETENES